MGIEERRQKLMLDKADWGAPPPASTRKPPINLPASTRADTTPSLISHYDNCASKLRDTTYTGMQDTPHDRYRCVHISTRDWSLHDLIDKSSNFHAVPRIAQYSHRLAETVKDHEATGKPLIIEKWEKHMNWDKASFTVEHFVENTNDNIAVRNVHDWTDKVIPLTDFIHKSRNAAPSASPNESERLYGKDALCPPRWTKWLQRSKTLPESLLPEGPGDLLRHRPKNEPVETLMCYLGIGDTFTPCHKDLCASSGHNLMVYTEDNGSSYWFMTESSSAPEAEKYFNSLEEILDHETYVITVEQLAKAPFKIYIAEQKLGDLVLVPPRSCHQVVNYGGITIKTSWSRMTLKGLETALYHELPLYRRVCRQETYRVKDTTYHALIKLTKELEEFLEARRRQSRESLVSASEISNDALVSEHVPDARAFRKLLESVLFLIGLYRSILMEDFPLENVSSDFADVPQRCDFCGADIFQTYFVCQNECQSDGENCVICSGCYAEGRSCKCEDMEPMQCRIFSELLAVHGEAVKTYNTAIQEGVCAEMKKIPFGLPPGKHPQIFQAAMILYNIRKQRPQTKVCSFPKGEHKHVVQFHSALSCRKCHAGKCFAHLLSDHRIHAVQALLLSKLNDSSQEYHETHQKGKERFDEAVAQILKSQREGVKPRDGNMLLVHNALTFGTCKPINPGCTKKGWYDIVVQVINPAPIADDWLSDSTSRFSPSSPSLETLPIRATSSARKSDRTKNLPYVLVPVAHYLRSRMGNVQKDRRPNGEEVINTSPVVKRKRRKSTSDSRHSVQFSTSNAHEFTTSRSGGALTDRSDVSPTGKPHPVGALQRKRKHEELTRSRPVQNTSTVIPQRHKSLEEALNGAGSINGRLPTESDEDTVNKLKGRTQKVRTPSSLGVKRRLPKSPKQSKAKASGPEPAISSESNDVVPGDDVVVNEATPAKRKRSGLSRRKNSSRTPATKPRRTVSYDEVVQVRLTRQRDFIERENLDMMEGVAQFGDGPIYNEAEDLVEMTMDTAPPEDSSPSQPSRPDFDERDSPTTSIPSPAHVPSRLRKRPRFQGVAENVESSVSPVLRRNSDNSSVQQNHIQDQPQRKRLDEQPAPQTDTPQVLSDLHAQTHVIQMTASQIMEFTQAITRQTVEEMTSTMLRGLILQTPAADQVPKEALSQAHARVGQENESGDTAPARTHGMDLKGAIKDAIREMLDDSAFTQQWANVAPPPTSNTMAVYSSAVPNNGHFASQHIGQMQYPQMQMHGRYDDNSAYLRYDNSVSMASRPDERGESSRSHQNIQRPHAPSRHSYPSVKPQHYPSRPGLRPRNPTFGGTGTLQRAQWDRPYEERHTSSNKVTSSRYRPYETKRTTRSSTRRQEAPRSDRSADSPVRESRYDQEYAPSLSSAGSPREKQAPAVETRITRSTTLASSSNRERQQQRREARTPPWESHPSKRNSEERTTTRKSNEERSTNCRASTDAVRDPQDWEDEYAQDDHLHGDTRASEPSSSKPDSLKSRHKRLTEQIQDNPWK